MPDWVLYLATGKDTLERHVISSRSIYSDRSLLNWDTMKSSCIWSF